MPSDQTGDRSPDESTTYSKPQISESKPLRAGFVRRLIPSVTAVTLTLGACGDSGGDEPRDETSGERDVKSLVTDYCDKRKECHPDDFVDSYEDVADCSDSSYYSFQEVANYGYIDGDCLEQEARCLLTNLQCTAEPDGGEGHPGFYMSGVTTSNDCVPDEPNAPTDAVSRCYDDSY